MLPVEAMWIFVTCAVACYHVDIHCPAVAGGCVDFCILWYHHRPCGYLWPLLLSKAIWCVWAMLPLEAMGVCMAPAMSKEHIDVHSLYCTKEHTESMVLADAGGHVDVLGFCHCQKRHGISKSMVSLTIKGKDTSFSIVYMIIYTQLRMRNRNLFFPTFPQPPPQKG